MSASTTFLMISLFNTCLLQGSNLVTADTSEGNGADAASVTSIENESKLADLPQVTKSIESEGEGLKELIRIQVEALFESKIESTTEKIERLRERLAQAELALEHQRENREAIVDAQVTRVLRGKNKAELKELALEIGRETDAVTLREGEIRASVLPVVAENGQVSNIRAVNKPSSLTPAKSNLSDDMSDVMHWNIRANRLQSKITSLLDNPQFEGKSNEHTKKRLNDEYTLAKETFEQLETENTLLKDHYNLSIATKEFEIATLIDTLDLKSIELAELETQLRNRATPLNSVRQARLEKKKLDGEAAVKKMALQVLDRQSKSQAEMIIGIETSLNKLKQLLDSMSQTKSGN